MYRPRPRSPRLRSFSFPRRAPPRLPAGIPSRRPRTRAQVMSALGASRDVWGDALLSAPGGPTVERVRQHLAPLLFARGPRGQSLTSSGVYYVPLSEPPGPQGATAVELHVADGSQLIARRVGGRSLTIFVGETRDGAIRLVPRASRSSAAERRLPPRARDRLRGRERCALPAGVVRDAATRDGDARERRVADGRRELREGRRDGASRAVVRPGAQLHDPAAERPASSPSRGFRHRQE